MQRPKRMIKGARAARLAAGALVLAGPGCALALSAQPSAAETSVQTEISSSRIRYGQLLTLSGTAGSQWGGRDVEIELQPAGSGAFTGLERVQTGADGSFRATLRLRSSGELEAVAAADGAQQSQQAAGPVPSTQAEPAPAPSAPEHVSVSARLRVRRRSLAVLAGQDPAIRGRLAPARGRRLVVLLGRRHGRWVRLAAAHTGPRGAFALRLPRSLSGTTALRVRFPGDRLNGPVSVRAGQAVVYQTAVASWYDDAGSTACGFHARYGVANLSLPCGARVSFRYGGRTVRAIVDDRGPYVGGREWDLNQNTAAALGFSGVGTVWYSD